MIHKLGSYKHYRVIVEHLILALITKVEFNYSKTFSLDKLLDEFIEDLKLKHGERKIIISEVNKVIGKEPFKNVWNEKNKI